MRLGGMEGRLVTTKEEAAAALTAAKNDGDIALVFLCCEVAVMLKDEIEEMKLTCPRPRLMEMPGPGDPVPKEDTIAKYIREAVGIR